MKKLLVSFSLTSALALAQAPDLKTLSGATKAMFNGVRTNVMRAAEKMPEENYSFRPTPDVRTFGQLVGHVADAQYLFCTASLGEKNPGLAVEKSKNTKAELVQALTDAFAYCDKAYNALTDTSALELMKIFNTDRPRASVLDMNTAHNNEHYGNMVTYMRIKGLVPPSSEPRR